MDIVQCVSCDGYGWVTDEFTGKNEDCDWCTGNGYVYRDANGVDHKIPEADYGQVADQLESLEQRRMRDMGYTGSAVHPSDQAVRKQDDEAES